MHKPAGSPKGRMNVLDFGVGFVHACFFFDAFGFFGFRSTRTLGLGIC